MKALIEKLRKAERGSPVLDGLIWKAISTGDPREVWHDFNGVWHLRDPADTIAFMPPPAFTTNFEAALALLPTNCTISLTGQHQFWHVEMWDYDTGSRFERAGDARSAALAVCIAALKWRQTTAR